MAWEISISADDCNENRRQLGTWESDALIAAICDDTFERVIDRAGEDHARRAADAEKGRLALVDHESLVDRAFELVEQNNTCDNGACYFWIDREGYYRVHLPSN